MEELGRLFAASEPDVSVVVTPHNVHISNAMGVIVAARVAGKLNDVSPPIELDVPSETDLAWSVLESIANAGVPVVGVSFGSNDPNTAVAPMDWGILIPLWFMGGRHDPPVPIVVVTPARDLPASDHVTAGAAIALAASRSRLRVAVIASADHGHAHQRDGPYGYDSASATYDALICELVRGNHLEELSTIPAELVEQAKADSWWQMLILHGATPGWNPRLISYEAPTYFGMMTAVFTAPP